jgi:NAD(P)-dependent dehydrogenase (short-subunit alcohol dehydrogenase family)
MADSNNCAGGTMVISGGSRGIGLAIAVDFARLGGNVVLLAKTDQPHPQLPGTVHTAVTEIEDAGGKAVAVVGDVRNGQDIDRAVEAAVDRFGGIDVVVNNASVLNLAPSTELSLKHFDLMQQVNVRGTFALTRACLPALVDGGGGHVLTLSPPLNFSQHWMGKHPGYMLAKYGMTLAALGFAAEYSESGISSNCLWPQSTIATAAVRNLLGGDAAAHRARSPQIMADAATIVLTSAPGQTTGQTLIDVDVLAEAGVDDLSVYGAPGGIDFDIFLDPPA